MLVLSAMGGTTGWHYSITRNAHYAPHVANYAGGAAGRTFPSAAGFHTAELFFTDDSGVYFFPTRDAGALVDPATEQITPQLMVERHRQRLRRLSTERLFLPAEEPYLEGHNTWCVNVPGSLLVIPVADIAQHLLAVLCFLTQNGYAIYDDIHNRALPEQYALTEATAELATSCYAGVLLLQAMGLGGWMFDGIDRFSILGASDNPDVPGLGFRYDTDEHWATPNPTGREGVFEAYCPPHYRTPASPYRPNTSSTPSGNSPPRCRRCSSSTTSKPTTWTSTSTTASSPPAPTCTHTPPTWTRGTDEKKPPTTRSPAKRGRGASTTGPTPAPRFTGRTTPPAAGWEQHRLSRNAQQKTQIRAVSFRLANQLIPVLDRFLRNIAERLGTVRHHLQHLSRLHRRQRLQRIDHRIRTDLTTNVQPIVGLNALRHPLACCLRHTFHPSRS